MNVRNEPARTYAEERRERLRHEITATRREEFGWLALVSIVVFAGLVLTYLAKVELANGGLARLTGQAVLDIHRINSAAAVMPYLSDIPDAAERAYVAERIYSSIHGHAVANVGALARLRVKQSDLAAHPALHTFRERIAGAMAQRETNRRERLARMSWLGLKFRAFREWLMPPPESDPGVPLLTQRQFHNLKPWLIVRTVGEFRLYLIGWAMAYFVAIYAVHLFWRYRAFQGDNLILPLIHLLTGIGFVLMVSLRDPLRDTLTFADFATGTVLGAGAMLLLSSIDYDRIASSYSYIFLAAAVVLGISLIVFGTGPGRSDAKVNLFGFQPVELVRVLLVFFLAGYFARHWDLLRDLRQKHGLPDDVSGRYHIPRLDYLIPVLAGTAISLLIFFLLKDLGPALVLGCLFLTLYAIARNRALAAVAGLGILVLGFAGGHAIGYPETVEQRVEIWSEPWRNTVPGGDHIAHSLWALSSGGWQGSGLGMGSPATVPAGHTDLILSVAGEEMGFAGLFVLFLVYGLLAYRSLRVAIRAPTAYSFFLVTGLTLIIVLQLLLIAGGLLNIIPLSGVVSPFLSFGKTSMIANFGAFGIIAAISARLNGVEQRRNFAAPMRVLTVVLGVCVTALISRAAYVQVFQADRIAIRDAEVRYADGGIGLENNPRIAEVAREMPAGDIFDRNGLPLATGSMGPIEQHRQEYARMGVALDRTVTKAEVRHYPLGPELFYLVGDVRSTLKQGARNTSFEEQHSRIRLQGYDDHRETVRLEDPDTGEVRRVWHFDYSELLPLLRHRYNPGSAAVRDLSERARDVRMSIDARLQLRASQILKNHLAPLGRKGAIVVLDPDTGDLLANVSYPWPELTEFTSFRANPDRSMERELFDRARFGLYPPGSAFKVVTAIAALRSDPALEHQTYECKLLDHGRIGNYIGKSRRPIRDDVQDKTPHGTVDMAKGIVVSCNAYFAQLGVHKVGAQNLLETAAMFGIDVARPNTSDQLKDALAQAAYGQGQVVATPFQMARVAAAVAKGGNIPQGRWVLDESNTRINEALPVLPKGLSTELAGFMRSVVTSPGGTGKVLGGNPIAIAGKTGTAEIAHGPSHAWFIGFAPYGAPAGKRIAFAVLVENGQYGGRTAAPISGELVTAARELGLL